MRRPPSLTLPLVVALIVAITPLRAASVRQLNLAEITQRATKIYVGTVRSASEGIVEIGGGRLAVVTYRLSVEEDLRGETPEVKGVRVAEFRMLGKQRPRTKGNLRFVSALPEMPTLIVGQSYLVFTTAPSKAGLSTTVGLGQGSFRLYGKAADMMAVNEANNAGLFRDMVPPTPSGAAARASGAAPTGPLPYATLRAEILNLVRVK